MEKRVFLIVLDSFGVGAEPDAPQFGDAGTNTLAAIAGALAAVAVYLRRREKELDEYERLLFGEDKAEPADAPAEDAAE